MQQAARRSDTTSSVPNLILGLVDGFTYYQVSRFLLTLRHTAFHGHICLFVGPKTGKVTEALIRRFGVEVIRYGTKFPYLRSPHPDNVAELPEPICIYNYRHYLYYDYLLQNRGRFDQVLLSDIRDVVFQEDPFDFDRKNRLHVAMENRQIPVGACACTSSELLAGYGEEVVERLSDEELSCAGTVLGPAHLVERYARLVLDQIKMMQDPVRCADQAAHNVLLHEGSLDPVERLYNFEGPILTVGTEPSYRLDRENRLINRDGSVINTIHQYDRHPELIALFEAKVRPTRSQRILAQAGFRAWWYFGHPVRTLRSAIRIVRGRRAASV